MKPRQSSFLETILVSPKCENPLEWFVEMVNIQFSFNELFVCNLHAVQNIAYTFHKSAYRKKYIRGHCRKQNQIIEARKTYRSHWEAQSKPRKNTRATEAGDYQNLRRQNPPKRKATKAIEPQKP